MSSAGHPAIIVEGLSKRYVLGSEERAGSFREAVTGMLTAPLRRLQRMTRGGGDTEFWALKDVNFTVQPGEVVGIIGRNGAGKSTLLKVLSRITPPTTGRVRLRGRVASLLEVGTGFHPELSGRENIYLNGAMLGMTRVEIRSKFDEIVAFSEVERFLDTPVKRYSSGMYVRLAFAVAAHLEPEILIVDEVLAVGDAEFQNKCLGKMKEVSTGSGRTVLFVSHNMAAIQTLCRKAVVMKAGSVQFQGGVDEGVRHYMSQSHRTGVTTNLSGRGFTLVSVGVTAPDGTAALPTNPAEVQVTLTTTEPCRQLGLHLFIEDSFGLTIFAIDTNDLLKNRSTSAGERVTITVAIDQLPLLPGPYRIRLVAKDDGRMISWECPNPFEFEVAEAPVYGTRQLSRQWHGLVCLKAAVTIDTAELPELSPAPQPTI